MTAPPGPLRVVMLLARVALLRRLNRISARLSRRRGRPADARSATPRKRGGRAMLIFLAVLFLYQGVTVANQFLLRLAPTVEVAAPEGRITVGRSAYDRIAAVLECPPPPAPCPDAPESITSILHGDPRFFRMGEEQRAAAVETIRRAIEKRGLGALLSQPVDSLMGLLPSAQSWCGPDHRERMAAPIGLVLTLLGCALFFVSLGAADAGRDWSMEWLFTFPVPAPALMFARVCEVAFADFFNLFTTLPLLFVVLWGAGFDWWAVPLAAVGAVYVGLVVGAAAVPTEAFFRKRLSTSRQRNLQGVWTAIGMVAFVGALATATAPAGPSWLVAAADHLPAFAWWTPFALPAQLVGAAAPIAGAAMIALTIAFPIGGAQLAAWQVRSGLVSAGGPYQGSRLRRGAASTRVTLGVVGKELRLLARNRSFFVQTMLLPALIFGMQVIINPALLRGAASDIHHGAMLAFGLGTYVLLNSALNLLSVEGEALWILSTVPRDLVSILVDKVKLWCAVALLWTVGTLIACAAAAPALELGPAALHSATAIAGVVIYSFIISGIGALATDPLEIEPQRRLERWAPPLVMLLGGTFAVAIYTPAIWPKVAQIVLSALLAAALWQKVRDRVPYLLDPTAAPPPRIAVADGLIAALAFFVLQGLVQLLVLQAAHRAPDGPEVLIAFVLAGVMVTALALYVGWRSRVPDLLASVGLRGARLLPSIGLGLGGGAVAALAGVGWLHLLRTLPSLQGWREEAERLALPMAGDRRWLLFLAVVAAPLFEEFIFRGLVYRGLRRSYPTGISVVASAAIFAIVHPALSAPPVFVLALVAALVFERSRLLVAPMLAHAVYNAAVVLAQ